MASGHCLLTREVFLGRCNALWNAAGLPRTIGHGFRIGGTTEFLLAGVTPVFHRYVDWRALEELANIRVRSAAHQWG
ncbi:hypothetical protein GGX14DRAFT_359946 [Mycena pura]|uniref:Uncharacterized protein n=1 Tax=Mycena pura TaxID=153505 RepID=A0AAD6YE90_9AGAR|nr:hypothetical protein GGX14DRAFT_359946 [Mycena pura]